jgi:hypothetical protein
MIEQTLADQFSPSALAVIIRANLWQDNIIGNVLHPERHFTENKIVEALAYIEAQRSQVISVLQEVANAKPALAACCTPPRIFMLTATMFGFGLRASRGRRLPQTTLRLLITRPIPYIITNFRSVRLKIGRWRKAQLLDDPARGNIIREGHSDDPLQAGNLKTIAKAGPGGFGAVALAPVGFGQTIK